MTTTVQAVYDAGVLKLRHRLPLPSYSEVLVTVEVPGNGAVAASAPVAWPDLAARLHALYGATVLTHNAVLTARSEERY